jgi:ribosomal protein S18 acetylase RimI-like enzyme
LAEAGVPHVTDMLLLARGATADDGNSSADAASVAYAEDRHARFAAVLERTCVGTLDCPELAAVRSGAEILRAHRETGAFNEALWRVYTLDGKDAGILLAADHPDRNAREIVYLGVAREMRGRRLGRGMLQGALRDAAAAGIQTMEVAVDARNRFALNIYRDLGFQEQSRLAVHLRLRLDSQSHGR